MYKVFFCIKHIHCQNKIYLSNEINFNRLFVIFKWRRFGISLQNGICYKNKSFNKCLVKLFFRTFPFTFLYSVWRLQMRKDRASRELTFGKAKWQVLFRITLILLNSCLYIYITSAVFAFGLGFVHLLHFLHFFQLD